MRMWYNHPRSELNSWYVKWYLGNPIERAVTMVPSGNKFGSTAFEWLDNNDYRWLVLQPHSLNPWEVAILSSHGLNTREDTRHEPFILPQHGIKHEVGAWPTPCELNHIEFFLLISCLWSCFCTQVSPVIFPLWNIFFIFIKYYYCITIFHGHIFYSFLKERETLAQKWPQMLCRISP